MLTEQLKSISNKPPCILTIDDDISVRNSFSFFLDDLGYQILEADNGEKGLELLHRKPDLVLLDLNLPQLDGLQFLHCLRDQDRDLPVIVISGTGRIHDVIEALRHGASDFLLKPITDLTILQLSIERALDQARLRRENREYRQHLEELVSKRTAALETLFDAAPLPILAIDTDSRVTLWNRAASELFGWQREEVVGQLYPLAAQEGEPEVQRHLQLTMSGHCCRGQEVVLLHRDGHQLVVNLSTAPLLDSTGSIYGLIVILEDVSEIRKLQSETECANRLASLGELSVGVAHEINNPNGLTLLNLPILKDFVADAIALMQRQCKLEPDLRCAGFSAVRAADAIPRLVDDIEDGAQRIKQIVEDLKAFSGQESFERGVDFDLNQSAEAAIRLTGSHLKKATYQFESLLSVEPLEVPGSAQRIEQVIVNLLVNACESLTSRDQKIIITTGRDEQDGEVYLCVSDEGRGIPLKQLPHITDPFFTTRRESGGTGLGLSVSARIVKEHNGRLEFNSQLGQGTNACLHLPATRRTDNETAI